MLSDETKQAEFSLFIGDVILQLSSIFRSAQHLQNGSASKIITVVKNSIYGKQVTFLPLAYRIRLVYHGIWLLYLLTLNGVTSFVAIDQRFFQFYILYAL